MRYLLPAVLFALSCLSGCEAVSERARDRFEGVPPAVRTVAGEQHAVYYAAQAAFKRLDFVLTSSSLGSANLEAASRIHESAAFRDSRQLVVRVHLVPAEEGKTELEISVSEVVEDPAAGGANEQPLRNHPFVDSYLAALEAILREQAAGAAPKNP